MGFSLLWAAGLTVSIIIFALLMGLVVSSNIKSNGNLTKLTICSFVSTLIIVYLLDLFKVQLNSIMGIYNYTLLFLIAFLLMLAGYIIIKEKSHERTFMQVILLSYLSFILMTVICIGSKESIFGLNSLQVSLLTSVLFNLVILCVFFGCKKLKLIDNSYKNFGSMYFILGIYCLVVSLFLPNIISINMGDMSTINIVSIEYTAFTFVLLIVIAVLGLLYYKKNTLLK